LLASDPAFPFSSSAVEKWLEKDLEKDPPPFYMFTICTLADERVIGHIGLDGVRWSHADSFVGIGIGEQEFWGKGYGTDAMQVMLRFAFTEMNLHRVSLTVFDYNPRALRSYEKAGFKIEGRARQMFKREGQRWDEIFMGILREEWESLPQ
jgi:RimJ/RimL family protein N-acetyltransferase